MSRSSDPLRISPNDPLRELFEACKSGDVIRVRAMVDSSNVNARDTAGRRSTPLHFAAGNSQCGYIFSHFPATQILREIKFGNFGVSKTAVLTFLESQKLDILGIFNTLECGVFS